MIPVKNQKLLTTAFTHRSYLNEDDVTIESNERLEYLGDAVLELAVSNYLYHKFPDQPEGELTALRSALVKTTTLAQVSSTLDVGDKLLMSRGEISSGGRQNPSLLANAFEAIVGAIYLDSGMDTIVKFLNDHLFPLLPDIIDQNLHRDFKSTFQETVQAEGHPTPTYQLVAQEGPDHDKNFTIALYVGDKKIATGTGKSKQLAQQAAARKGLEKLEAGLKL